MPTYLVSDEGTEICRFKIGATFYEIIPQSKHDYAVRRKKRGQSWIWLEEPESRYETETGAQYAILLDLERGQP